MDCLGSVVHAETFTSKKNGKVYTKLFVPVGFDVVSVIAEGDRQALAGCSDVPFRLALRDGVLKLFYSNGKEE